jgi:hypothetical protein
MTSARQVFDRHLEHVQVAGERRRGQATVVKHLAPPTTHVDRHECREAVLGYKLVAVTEIGRGVPAHVL